MVILTSFSPPLPAEHSVQPVLLFVLVLLASFCQKQELGNSGEMLKLEFSSSVSVQSVLSSVDRHRIACLRTTLAPEKHDEDSSVCNHSIERVR